MLFKSVLDAFGFDLVEPAGVGVGECGVGDLDNIAWQAAGGPVQQVQRAFGEGEGQLTAGRGPAMLHHRNRIVFREGREHAELGHTAEQLAAVFQQGDQLQLAEQDHLDQPFILQHQVRERLDHPKHVTVRADAVAQVLRFIQEQQRRAPGDDLFGQKLLELVEGALLRAARLQAELGCDRLEKGGVAGLVGVVQDGDRVAAVREAGLELVEDRRFAGADVAVYDRQTALVADGVLALGDGFGVVGGEVEVVGIGGGGERVVVEFEISAIHAGVSVSVWVTRGTSIST